MSVTKEEDHPSTPPSLSDALLFTTLCIVGLPVEVQVKDGSLYSGVFHTACIDKGYGIVLKKARKIGGGKGEKNLAVGAFMDTLVVLSGDLAQVVVKDFLLPAEGVVGGVVRAGVENACGDTESMNRSVNSEREKIGKESENGDGLRQVGKDRQHGRDGSSDNTGKNAGKRHFSNHTSDPSLPQVDSVCETHVDVSIKKNSHVARCISPSVFSVEPEALESQLTALRILRSPATLTSNVSTSSTTSFPVSDNKVSSDSRKSKTDQSSLRGNSVFNEGAKVLTERPLIQLNELQTSIQKREEEREFKLNPEAKVFIPSVVNSISTPAPSIISSMDHVSNISPAMPIYGSQSAEICSFASRSALPSKLVQYGNMVSGHSAITAQYSLSIGGHAGIRQEPVRYSGQYHPIQAEPAYAYPNSQAVMVGRLGQVMHVHPFPQDAIQGTPVLSQGLSHPMLAPYQANVTKLQGGAMQTLQVYMAAPLVAGGGQPLAMPNQHLFPQPFPPPIRPISSSQWKYSF